MLFQRVFFAHTHITAGPNPAMEQATIWAQCPPQCGTAHNAVAWVRKDLQRELTKMMMPLVSKILSPRTQNSCYHEYCVAQHVASLRGRKDWNQEVSMCAVNTMCVHNLPRAIRSHGCVINGVEPKACDVWCAGGCRV